MKIELNNVEEAGMPEEMAGHCRQLIERQIVKNYDGLPAAGDEITILYSEEDPLLENDEVDDSAYFLYFTVEKTEDGEDGGTVFLNLEF